MDARQLNDTAKAMVAGDKGLLAMDESTPTANKRFAATGIPQTEEIRRAYRDMMSLPPDSVIVSTAPSWSMKLFVSKPERESRSQRHWKRSALFPASRSTLEPSQWLRIPAKRSRRGWTDCATG